MATSLLFSIPIVIICVILLLLLLLLVKAGFISNNNNINNKYIKPAYLICLYLLYFIFLFNNLDNNVKISCLPKCVKYITLKISPILY